MASRSSASEAAALKRRHYQWLLETGQDEEAGRVKERDGDFVGAISLFLKGGLPGKAAQVNAAMHAYCAPHWCDGLEWCRLPLLQHFYLLWARSCICMPTEAAGWFLCSTSKTKIVFVLGISGIQRDKISVSTSIA